MDCRFKNYELWGASDRGTDSPPYAILASQGGARAGPFTGQFNEARPPNLRVQTTIAKIYHHVLILLQTIEMISGSDRSPAIHKNRIEYIVKVLDLIKNEIAGNKSIWMALHYMWIGGFFLELPLKLPRARPAAQVHGARLPQAAARWHVGEEGPCVRLGTLAGTPEASREAPRFHHGMVIIKRLS